MTSVTPSSSASAASPPVSSEPLSTVNTRATGRDIIIAIDAGHGGKDPGTDKLFYLTAKTPGRQLALDALDTITKADTTQAIPLRVLERVARDKA